MAKEISNSDDIIDSRDLLERIEGIGDELEEIREARRQDMIDNLIDGYEGPDIPQADLRKWAEEKVEAVSDEEVDKWLIDNDSAFAELSEEFRKFKEFADEFEGYSSDFKYGAQAVRDSYFLDHAQQMAEDMGAIDRNASWPNNCIDWERAADELKQDYSCIDFDGVEYWVR